MPHSRFQDNPFAICSAKIDRKKEPAKWERCVKKVKKEMGLSEKTEEAFQGEIPGGGYVAESDAGEFWTIRDVPFFSELPAGVRSNTEPIGRDWMHAVIRRHEQLERDQKHLPPVHANHHDSGRDNFRLGFLRPTKVGQIVLDGKKRWALFGDIIHIENHHYQSIKALGYPYRSAEIGRGWSPEIASLALSEDEAPHFKLPMLTIGSERRPFDRTFSPENAPALAFSEVADSSFVCFSFRGAKMPKPKTDKLVSDTNDKDPDEEKLAEDEVGQKIAKVIADFQSKLPDIIKNILEDMIPPTVRTAEGETPVEPSMLRAVREALGLKTDEVKMDKEKTGDKTKDVEHLAELTAKIASLEEKNRQREKLEKVDVLVAAQIATLKTEGWHLAKDTETAMRDIATASETALEKFVAEYKKNTPKDPPKSLDAIPIFKEEPPEMQKYRTQSPEVLSAALALSKQFDDLQEQGCKLSSTREEFIDINLESAEHV